MYRMNELCMILSIDRNEQQRIFTFLSRLMPLFLILTLNAPCVVKVSFLSVKTIQLNLVEKSAKM